MKGEPKENPILTVLNPSRSEIRAIAEQGYGNKNILKAGLYCLKILDLILADQPNANRAL